MTNALYTIHPSVHPNLHFDFDFPPRRPSIAFFCHFAAFAPESLINNQGTRERRAQAVCLRAIATSGATGLDCWTERHMTPPVLLLLLLHQLPPHTTFAAHLIQAFYPLWLADFPVQGLFIRIGGLED